MRPLLDMLYPRGCIGCGEAAPEPFRHICWECWSDTTKITPPFCRQCGDPVAGTIEHEFLCYACAACTPSFDAARSAARYDGVVGLALRQLKYEHALWLAPDLAALLQQCLRAEYPEHPFDWVVPVPLHPVRRRARGYNQAALLARELSRRIKVPTKANTLLRTHPTPSQTHLTAPERISNVAGAFETRRRSELKGKRILLVDDVMTTGATVNACAKALKIGGAKAVYVITAARG